MGKLTRCELWREQRGRDCWRMGTVEGRPRQRSAGRGPLAVLSDGPGDGESFYLLARRRAERTLGTLTGLRAVSLRLSTRGPKSTWQWASACIVGILAQRLHRGPDTSLAISPSSSSAGGNSHANFPGTAFKFASGQRPRAEQQAEILG